MTSFLSTILKHNSSPAPSFLPSNSKKDEPVIPDPAAFTISPLKSSVLGPLAPPSVSQCAVHLELLQAISKLKHRVVKEAAFIEIFGTVDEERETWWGAFVEVSVGRFGTWWWGVEEELRRREGMTGSVRNGLGGGGVSGGGWGSNGECQRTPSQMKSSSLRNGIGAEARMSPSLRNGIGTEARRSPSLRNGLGGEARRSPSLTCGLGERKSSQSLKGGSEKPPSIRSGLGDGVKVRELPEDLLPPLDVLMVWHAYMLNPRCYNEDALYFNLNLILNTAFPWSHIHAAIDNESFTYTLPDSAARFFERLTNQSPRLMDELLWKDVAPRKSIKCPSCNKIGPPVRICDSEKKGGGWMDADFRTDCGGCGVVIDKKGLYTEKFRLEIEEFLKAGPQGRMRMTLLDRQGHAYTEDPNSSTWESANFVNDLFRKTFPKAPSADEDFETLEKRLYADIDMESEKPSNLSALKACLDAFTATPRKFSLNLNGAVIRQGSFVEKMNVELWIRSPGLVGRLPLESLSTVRAKLGGKRSCVLVDNDSGFLKRAVERYEGFFALFKAHPGNILVPTLDVDLVWHSAMLTPIYYRFWCRNEAGRFIDHDDKIGTGTLDNAFEFTNGVYVEAFGKPYSKCCCWFCEAAINEGLDPDDGKGGKGLWGKVLKRKPHRSGKKERAVRVRVEFYREVEKRRRSGMGGLAWNGLFEALKRC